MSTLNQLAKEFNDEKARLIEKSKAILSSEFKKAFQSHPEVTCLVWTQYTPHFNDGEACTFNIHEFYVSNGDPDKVTVWGEYDDYEEEELGKVFVDVADPVRYPEFRKLEAFAHSDLGYVLFEEMFGDHVRIVATAEGFTVDEYEHD